jgi:adenosine deaminase
LNKFIEALQRHSLSDLQAIPKSDLHNHAGRGGNKSYIEDWAKVRISPPAKPFDSLDAMQEWFQANIKPLCPGIPGYLKRIEAAFAQAKEDHITVLSMSFGIGEIHVLGNMEAFTAAIDKLHREYAPQTAFYPELAVGRESDAQAVLNQLDEILEYKWFKSIDICNDELAQPIRNFKPVYKRAKEACLQLIAHVGEFGSADDVMEAVEELELHEVHHGIAAAGSVQIMQWLARHHIRLNVCPTSNVMLGTADSYESHPVRDLYHHGIPVTINTDDLLIFNQSISQEYLNLFKAGTLSAEELNAIREAGLQRNPPLATSSHLV